MTTNDRFDRRLETGLEQLAEPRFPDYLNDVLAVTSRRRQRPAWTFPGRWIPMVDIARRPAFALAMPWRFITLLIALMLIAALALFVAGSRPRVPSPFGPASNGLIPYSSFGDLYLGNPNGASTVLLKNADQHFDPAYSRSGTIIAFLRGEASNKATLWTIHPDGSHLTQITPTPVDPVFWDWGPTDDDIYFVSPENGVPRLHVARADGSAPPRLVADDLIISAFWFRPPEGREMVVRVADYGHVRLDLMNVDGSNRRPFVAASWATYDTYDMAEPRYSPDGSRLVYQHWDAAVMNMQLHVVDADGTNDRVVHWGNATWEGWPVWMLDSKRIIFQRAFETPEEQFGFGHPFAVGNADGTGAVREIGPPVAGQHAELSPDGTRLLQFRDTGETQILINPEDGSYTTVPWQANSYPNWQRLAP